MGRKGVSLSSGQGSQPGQKGHKSVNVGMKTVETADGSKVKVLNQDSVMVEEVDLQSPKSIAHMYSTPHWGR
jgi:hypothetical protein